MKLHLNTDTDYNVIRAHGAGYVTVNTQRIEHPLVILPNRLIEPWLPEDVRQPGILHFAALLDLKPEVVLFGSGGEFRFPQTAVLRAFADAHIGLEVMDTAAACRTYNVLASEGRYVAAALLL